MSVRFPRSRDVVVAQLTYSIRVNIHVYCAVHLVLSSRLFGSCTEGFVYVLSFTCVSSFYLLTTLFWC